MQAGRAATPGMAQADNLSHHHHRAAPGPELRHAHRVALAALLGALSLLQSNYFVDYSVVMAGVILSTIPLLILFVVAGRQLVSGIMQGAIKG